MNYSTPERFRTALEDRLRQLARATGLPVVRLRKDVVFDRLLARLLVAAPGRWVLKGGLALDYRLGDRARTTKDLDLGRHDDADASAVDLMAAARLDLGDFFRYTIEQTDALAELEDAAAVRYRLLQLSHRDQNRSQSRSDSWIRPLRPRPTMWKPAWPGRQSDGRRVRPSASYIHRIAAGVQASVHQT